MLVDLAGDDDEAEDDALVDLDGVEQPRSDEEDDDEDFASGRSFNYIPLFSFFFT